jgi:acetolactate synthase I/II/III large subunit
LNGSEIPDKESMSMAKSGKHLGRRGFLKGAAAGAAALATPLPVATAQAPAPQRATAPLPTARQIAAESEPVSTEVDVLTADHPGSDFMVDVIKSLGFDYIAANPGASFRAFQESVVNYGGNKSPEWLTCTHEESSVFMADGYGRVEGRAKMAVAAHGTVGLQHASMAVYNAFVARSPVFIILGNHTHADERRPGVEWAHSAQDVSAMVRDYIKWDDLPQSLTHWAESAVRAYKIAMTLPRGPVILVADGTLQETPVPDIAKLRVPKYTAASAPAGDPAAVAEVAKLLVNAENPVILGGLSVRTPECMKLLVELAETLQAPVQGGKFPSRHPLSGGGGGVRNADVILGLEVSDFWGTVNNQLDQQERIARSIVKPGTKLISISPNDLYLKSNYQEFGRFTELDFTIPADVEATLPSLIDACKRLITADRRRVLDERGKKLASGQTQAFEQARNAALYAWNASPISTARLTAEMWELVKNKDWACVSGGGAPVLGIPGRLWNVDKHYQTLPTGGAAAVGTNLPMSIGAALAHRKYGRFCFSFQPDGDMMYAPGVLWTAAHHRIPLLIVMNNNRAYHQEVMHLQRMANRHQRGITNAGIGTRIDDPNIDYATVARGMGAYGEGPISNPSDLGPALKRAAERVEHGEVAVVDVVTQPR